MSGKQVLNKEDALKRLAGDEDLWKEIIPMSLEDAPKYLTEIAKSLKIGNFDTARVSAHTLKSLMGNIGADEAHHFAYETEHACKQEAKSDATKAFQELLDACDRLSNHISELDLDL